MAEPINKAPSSSEPGSAVEFHELMAEKMKLDVGTATHITGRILVDLMASLPRIDAANLITFLPRDVFSDLPETLHHTNARINASLLVRDLMEDTQFTEEEVCRIIKAFGQAIKAYTNDREVNSIFDQLPADIQQALGHKGERKRRRSS